jgi:signal transduction histidine kinase
VPYPSFFCVLIEWTPCHSVPAVSDAGFCLIDSDRSFDRHPLLLPGSQAYCRDFAERQKPRIEFDSEAIPPGTPHEISLCLFRVLQEALHNAAKHSQVLYFKVQIRASPHEIALIVSDAGVGFDPQAEGANQGLGLASMREPVRLVKGTIAIESKAMAGTTILVRVPVKAPTTAQLAAS